MRKKIVIDRAERLHMIPSSLFLGLKRKANRAARRGVEVIDLTLANPQEPPSPKVVEALCRATREEQFHRYNLGSGLAAFRRQVALWFESQFGVVLRPELEVLPILGVWEALLGLPLAFVNPEDVVLLPDPCYPLYRTGAILAGARVETMPLLERNDFLPNLQQIPEEVAHQAKLMYLNYPNNPTTAGADLSFFAEVMEFARAHNVAVVHDATYVPITPDDYQAPSFLQVQGAKSLAVELYSLSMSHHLGGWRIGFAVGNRQLLAGLMAARGCGYVGPAPALQAAAVQALSGDPDQPLDLYSSRRETMVQELRKVGLKVRRSKFTPFLWVSVPGRYSSLGFSRRLFRRTGVLVTPGSGFGEWGEGFVRISLTAPQEQLHRALQRIEEQAFVWQRKHGSKNA